MIQGALNGTDVTPKGTARCCSPHHGVAALPELLAQTQPGCSCPGSQGSPRTCGLLTGEGQGTPEPGLDGQSCHRRGSRCGCLGVTGWLSSLGRLLAWPFASSPVSAAGLGFVPMVAVSAPKPQCEGQEVAWDRSRTTCALGIALGFGVTVPNGSTHEVSEPHIIF